MYTSPEHETVGAVLVFDRDRLKARFRIEAFRDFDCDDYLDNDEAAE